MAANTRSKEQREFDLVKMSEMYLRGETQHSMAEEFGVAQSQVWYDLQIIRDRWLQSQLINFNEAKAKELARLDHLEATAWDAWERSKGKKQKRKITSGDIGEGKDGVSVAVKTETTKWIDVGDPRFLGMVMSCIDKRTAILGLDAPKKTAQTDAAGNDLPELDRRRLAFASLAREILGPERAAVIEGVFSDSARDRAAAGIGGVRPPSQNGTFGNQNGHADHA